jgi:hypothetical protein
MIGNAGSKSSAQQAYNCSYAPSWWGRVRLRCGVSMVVMYLQEARRWTGSAGHGIVTA